MSTETRKRLLVGNSPKLALLHNHVVKPFHPATPANKRGECTPDHQRLPLSVGVTEWIQIVCIMIDLKDTIVSNNYFTTPGNN